MNNKYIELEKGLFIRKHIIKTIKKDYNHIKIKVFDLDGTILNGYALSIVGFSAIMKKAKKLDTKNLLKLFKAINLYLKLKNKSIEYISTEFAKIITGLKKNEFLSEVKKIDDKIYENFKKQLKKMDKNKIYVITLSDKDFIENPLKKLKIKNFEGRLLKTENGIFTGKFIKDMKNSKKTKLDLLNKQIKNKKFVYFGNDLDDELVFKKASLKIGINPKKRLLKKVELDIISNGKDPWKNLHLFLYESKS